MPKRKERMAGYIRESDPALANSTTIESQAKAVREYAKKEGYITVCFYIFDLLKQHIGLREVANTLNDIGIPPPRKPRKGVPHWTAPAIHRIATNPIYTGEVWANRFQRVGNRITMRPKADWIQLPVNTAPALIDKETFDQIQKQLKSNKEEALRNNKHREELGLLRSGHIFCGVCGQRMHVEYPSQAAAKKGSSPLYRCHRKIKGTQGIAQNHSTQIHMPYIDGIAYQKIVEVITNPTWVRGRVEELRAENKPVIVTSDVEHTIETIRQKMQNLYTLAENAPDDEELARLTHRMQELGKQKREAEGLLYELEEDEEERAEMEDEIVKFERWAEKVRPYLADSGYTPTYEELRLAVRILGVKVIVFPTKGE
jgi:hypothetical protein